MFLHMQKTQISCFGHFWRQKVTFLEFSHFFDPFLRFWQVRKYKGRKCRKTIGFSQN